jgi:tRNA threonylcarbamoyladenosine biosynthesis protein TsaB
MILDLYVDTSRKGVSMAIASADRHEESVNPEARGETLGGTLDDLLKRMGATLDDVKRVMVTLGPGSFSGLRTGVAFCQGICFSGKRNLYGVTTLQALQQFAGPETASTAVVIRARNGYWYMRLDGKEYFIETAEVVEKVKAANIVKVVADDSAMADAALQALFADSHVEVIKDTDQKLQAWAPLFDTVKPSLIQEANYIQPSYFEKLSK